MNERVAKLVGTELAMGLNMGTFHSVFSRILRREAAHIGFTSNYTIYDEADARSLINSIIKDMGLDDNIYKAANVRYHILSLILLSEPTGLLSTTYAVVYFKKNRNTAHLRVDHDDMFNKVETL